MTTRTEPPAGLARFRWRRMEDPHWIDVDGESVLSGWGAEEWYEPLRSDPALFRNFARLPDEPDAFAGFARDHGDLDGEHLVMSDDDHEGRGHTFEYWRGQRQLLAFAVDLWDAIREERADALVGNTLLLRSLDETARGFMWTEDRVDVTLSVAAPISEALLAVARGGRRASSEQAAEDGRYADADGTIAYLERRLSPKATARAALAQFTSSRCRNLSVALVVTNAPGSPFRLTHEVDSLIDAMWLQLALAIDGEREYRSCPVCGRWWDVTASRSDKLTCSDRCRKSWQRSQMTETKEGD